MKVYFNQPRGSDNVATIKDVAKHAGVSVATASRAIRNVGYVSEENKSKVSKAVKALNYTPDLNAKTLRSGKSNVIGVVVSDLGNYFYNIVLSKIEQDLKKLGYVMLLCYSNEDTSEELQNLNLMLQSRVDGIIFTPVSNTNDKIIQSIKSHGIPILQLYRNAYPGFDSVVVDDETGAYLATKNLIEKGHRDILLFGVDSSISPSRTNGYKRAFNEASVKVNTDYIIECSIHNDIKELAKEKIRKLNPTAIVAGTNTFGYDIVTACKEEGLIIPDDISFIVFDDVSWVSLNDISVIWQPVNGIASSAVQILIKRIQTSEANRENSENESSTNIKIEPSLIQRKSVKAYKRKL